jgi:maleylacetate reductase
VTKADAGHRRGAAQGGRTAVRPFVHFGNPATIVFGAGRSAETGDWIGQLGGTRALVLSTPGRREAAGAYADGLGGLAAGVFSGAAMHTPVEVTERALERAAACRADCTVALGGGSAIGLGKAIALRAGLPQIAIPTTYAGSEATPILGQTEGGKKTTLRDMRVLPRIVIYDPELTPGLPVGVSVASGLNAMAHAAEGLYAADRNPVSTLMAAEGLRAMKEALPRILKNPGDPDARAGALCGAWLCGSVLGAVGMALHHKLCHTLGGSFGLPHAETHAVILPHAIAFNEAAARSELEPAAALFGGATGAGLRDFAALLGAPTALKDIGMKASDLDRAAVLATENPYPNPRPIDRSAIRGLLQDAWEGRRPGS